MNVFKIDKFYRYTLLGVLLGCIILFLTTFTHARAIESFIIANSGVIMLVIFVYSLSVRVEISDGILTKSSILGKRVIVLADIGEVTRMSFWGRYVFLFITPDSYTSVSTLMENFPVFSAKVKENVTENAYKVMGEITPQNLRKKNLFMRGVMIVIIALCLIASIYTSANARL